jgi:DNA-directed RNA polymerase specialized sigma24 family protein
VSEGFEKMFTSDQFTGIQSVAHFYARFTLCMKHAMIDYYRTKKSHRRATCRSLSRAAIERGERYRQGRFDKSSLQDPAYPLVEVADILAVMSAESAMARRAAQVFELQFFGALTVREMMNMMGVSQSTIEADLRYAKAFILEQLLPDELDAHDDAPTTD